MSAFLGLQSVSYRRFVRKTTIFVLNKKQCLGKYLHVVVNFCGFGQGVIAFFLKTLVLMIMNSFKSFMHYLKLRSSYLKKFCFTIVGNFFGDT